MLCFAGEKWRKDEKQRMSGISVRGFQFFLCFLCSSRQLIIFRSRFFLTIFEFNIRFLIKFHFDFTDADTRPHQELSLAWLEDRRVEWWWRNWEKRWKEEHRRHLRGFQIRWLDTIDQRMKQNRLTWRSCDRRSWNTRTKKPNRVVTRSCISRSRLYYFQE